MELNMRIAFGAILVVLGAGLAVFAQGTEKHVEQTISGTGYAGAPISAAKPVVNQLDGTWINDESRKASLAQIAIDGLNVHLFGACTPTPCDMGILEGRTFAASVRSRGVDAMTAQMQTRFSEMSLTLSLETDERLRVDIFTHFTDGSKRTDYHHVDYMVHEPVGQPAAVGAQAANGNQAATAARKISVPSSMVPWNADLLIPPAFYAVQGAPFNALVRETITPTGSATMRRFVRMLRDSEGRQRYEDLVNAVATSVQLFDVVGQRSIRLDPVTRTAVSCPAPTTSQPVRVPASTPDAQKDSRLPNPAAKNELAEDSGEPLIAGLQAALTHTTHKNPAVQTANVQPAGVEDELWTSPLYRMPLKRVTDSPKHGHIELEVVSFEAGEPNGSLFQIPKDYAVQTEADNACDVR
jgi:hypothetical protein